MKNSSTDSFKIYSIRILFYLFLFLLLLEGFLRLFIITVPNSVPQLVSKSYIKEHEIVSIGDSHFYRAFINSKNINDLSMGGLTIPAMNEIIKHLVKYKPKKLILEASPQLFSQSHYRKSDMGFKNYFVLPKYAKVFIFEPGVTEYLASINNYSSFVKIINHTFKNPKISYSSWNDISLKKRIRLTHNRIQKQKPNINDAHFNEFKSIYVEMIDNALNNGIKVCLLRTPVTPRYAQITRDYPDFSVAQNFFINLADNLNLTYVDYNDLNISYTLSSFSNQDHITPETSKIFSKLVLEKCKF